MDPLRVKMAERERQHEVVLDADLPIILRVDGKNFKSLTRDLQKPFDLNFQQLMEKVAEKMCQEIQHVSFGYVVSDEICFLLDSKGDVPWCKGDVARMISVASSMASSVLMTILFQEYTTRLLTKFPDNKIITFRAKVFNLSRDEVRSYFINKQNQNKRGLLLRSQQYGINKDEVPRVQEYLHGRLTIRMSQQIGNKHQPQFTTLHNDWPLAVSRLKWTTCFAPEFQQVWLN